MLNDDEADVPDDEAPLRQSRKRPLSPSEAHQDLHTLSWISKALSHIHSADGLITARKDFESSHALSPSLRMLRSAAMTLFINADDAMLDAQTKHYNIQQQIHEEKLSALLTELAETKEQARIRQTALLRFARKEQAAILKQEKEKSQIQSTLFSKEKKALTSSYKLERNALIDQHRLEQKALTSSYKSDRDALIDQHRHEQNALSSSYKSEKDALIDQHRCEQKALQRQLEEEREKSFCCICLDKPRDTIILPCLHFQYCFSCLLRHREANSNTCPSCRGPIQGLSMSSYLAAQ